MTADGVECGMVLVWAGEAHIQIFGRPLCFLYKIESSMDNELVHMLRLFAKSCNAISTHFGCAKVQLEERVVASADDGEVVGHLGVKKKTSA